MQNRAKFRALHSTNESHNFILLKKIIFKVKSIIHVIH